MTRSQKPDRRRASGERGDTLVEVLVAVTVIAIAVATLLGAILTSTSTSLTHRNLTTLDGVLRSFAESARNGIETASGGNGAQFAACASPSSYKVVGNPNPGSGPVGTTITVFGTGFSSATGTATFKSITSGGSTNTSSLAQPMSGNTGGSWVTFNAPTLPYGTYQVYPYDGTSPAASTFTVTPSVSAVTPNVPASVGPGTKIKFSSVAGFAPNSALTATIAGTAILTGVSTTANGTAATVTATLPGTLSSSQIVSVTVSDASGDSAPPVQVIVASDTAAGTGVPSGSPFGAYTLTSSVKYWDSSSNQFHLSVCPSLSSHDSQIEQLTYTLGESQQNAGASDSMSIVVTSFGSMTSTATSLSSTANPSVSGQSITYTATVSVVAPGTGTPPTTDSVTFIDLTSGTTLCSAVPISGSGQASCGPSRFFPGVTTDAIEASFSGDVNYSGSSGTLVQTVNQAATTTALSSSVNPSVTGQTVTYTATVTVNAPGFGTPSAADTVAFTDNGLTISGCSAVPLSGGVAHCPTSESTAGSHSIVATSSGDTNFAGSFGSLTQTVNKANTSTQVTSSTNPSIIGQQVTFTATVTIAAPGGGSLPTTDTVSFTDNGVGMSGCSAVNLNGSGQATCSTIYLAVGVHNIVATYAGDPNYNASTSSTLVQTVTTPAHQTQTSVVGNPNPVKKNVSVTFTATVTVTGGGSIPTSYTVAFLNGNTPIAGCASVNLNSSGQASCTTTFPSKSTVTVNANFNGDAIYGPSSGNVSESVTN